MTTSTTGKSKRPGISAGGVNEATFFFTVQPGHEKQMREGLEKFIASAPKRDPANYRKVGIHELRQVLFDNDRRYMLAASWEGDSWDKYIEDIIVGLGVDNINQWLVHVEGGKPGLSLTQMKEAFAANQVTAMGYQRAIPEGKIEETFVALRVNRAFQQVLNHPDAAKALAHPALAPLLKEAAY